MKEIKTIYNICSPVETLFIADSMTGQDAVNTAKSFNDVLNFDGVILTKLDGDTRGGAAISIKSVVHKPIKFIGTGEKMEAIDVFHPSRMADRILVYAILLQCTISYSRFYRAIVVEVFASSFFSLLMYVCFRVCTIPAQWAPRVHSRSDY